MQGSEPIRETEGCVGLCTVTLWMPGSQSLKSKRRVVRSLVDRLRSRFNVSVAEVGGQSTWQRATLAVACVAGDAARVRQELEAVMRCIELCSEAEVTERRIEIW